MVDLAIARPIHDMEPMTSLDDHFSETYAEARARFHDACRAAGAALQSHDHPLAGPDGERLTLDVARLGPAEARRVLVVCAGTHGVEGFCGSAAQTAWLAGGRHRDRPEACAVVLVHGLNPFGFAWLRRVNEDNVDLNRNFVDFARPLPANPGYDALAAAICPVSLDADDLARAQDTLDDYGGRHGPQALHGAIVGGQYGHPHGLFYGGRSPAWSNRVFRHMLARELRSARLVAYVDIHTGYGPKGRATLLGNHTAGSSGQARLERWLGAPVQPSGDGREGYPDTSGDTGRALFDELGDRAGLAAFCLEFGTEPEEVVFDALRRENWLHHHGPNDPALAQGIKEALRGAFAPRDSSWRQAVVDQALETIHKLLVGLSEEPLEP